MMAAARVLAALIGCCLLMLGAPARAETLEGLRLFTDPEQRARITARTAKPSAPSPDQTKASRRPPRLRLQGLLARSGRPTRVWINGKQLQAGQALGEIQILAPPGSAQRGSVLLHRAGHSVQLRPGENLHLSGIQATRLRPSRRGAP